MMMMMVVEPILCGWDAFGAFSEPADMAENLSSWLIRVVVKVSIDRCASLCSFTLINCCDLHSLELTRSVAIAVTRM